jgi:hypothetical protein
MLVQLHAPPPDLLEQILIKFGTDLTPNMFKLLILTCTGLLLLYTKLK